MVYLVGITGGIGGGKSTVASFLQEMGATIIDTDQIAREITVEDADALDEIHAEFGGSVFNPDGSLNRKAMAEIVFNDAAMLAKLNAILHPRIRTRWVEKASRLVVPIAFVIVPLLYENNLEVHFNEIWVATADEEERIQRVMKRDSVPRESVLKRIANQMKEEEKISRADIVLDTSGRLEDIRVKVEREYHNLLKRRGIAG